MQKCAKMANFWTFGLNYWETVEDRWVHAAMRLTSIESMPILHVTFTAIAPRVVPREAKMYLRDLGIDIPTHRRGLLASNVCIFIQLSITSFSVMSLHRH